MKLKKVWSSLLVAAMTFSLAACGNGNSGTAENAGSAENVGNTENVADNVSASGETKEITVAIPCMSDMEYADDVQNAINEIAEERYGIKYNFEFISYGNWSQQSNLLLTGDEVDVIAAFITPLSTYVKNGQFVDLTNYVNNASDEFKKIWTEGDLYGTSVQGSIYAIPTYKNYGSCAGLMIDATIAEEMGVKDRQVWTLADISDFLYDVAEKYPDRYPLVPNGNSMISYWSWDGLGDSSYVGVLTDRGQDTTVQNLYDTDDFQEICKYTRQWYQNGLILPDVLSNTESGSEMIRAGKAVSTFAKFANGDEPGCYLTIVEDAWSEANCYNVSYGINANAKDKDAAWKALEILYTDLDVRTLLVQGIEDVTYVDNGDGTISYIDGKSATESGYGMPTMYWILPNANGTTPIDSYGTGFYEEIEAFNADTLKSKAYGFYFNTTEVSDQYTACINVMNKYTQALLSGTVDVESTIEQADSELKAAGLNDVIEAKQAQLDAFLAQ